MKAGKGWSEIPKATFPLESLMDQFDSRNWGKASTLIVKFYISEVNKIIKKF